MLLQPPSKKGAFFLPSKDSLGTTHALFEVSIFFTFEDTKSNFPICQRDVSQLSAPPKMENTQLPLGPSRDEVLDAWESTLILEPEHMYQNHLTSSRLGKKIVILILSLPSPTPKKIGMQKLKLFLLLCPHSRYPRHCVRCACCVHCAQRCVQSGPTFHDPRDPKLWAKSFI